MKIYNGITLYEPGSQLTLTTNMTLTTIVSINSYVVIFNSNGGTTIQNQNVNYGTKVIKASDQAKNGYIFEGWYEDSSFSSTFNFDSQKKSNKKLYSKWKEETTQREKVQDL